MGSEWYWRVDKINICIQCVQRASTSHRIIGLRFREEVMEGFWRGFGGVLEGFWRSFALMLELSKVMECCEL